MSRIIYVTSAVPNPDQQTQHRLEFAENSIKIQPEQWHKCKLQLKRNATSIGDGDMPFIRDMVECAMAEAGEDDIIVLVNADICFVKCATNKIRDAMESHDSAFAHRWDFGSIYNLLSTEEEVASGTWYYGSDFFCLKPEWWRKNNHYIPDMVLGREAWDMVFRRSIKLTGGTEIKNLIYHKWHPSKWETERETLSGNLHNRKLAGEWLAIHGGDYYDWR